MVCRVCFVPLSIFGELQAAVCDSRSLKGGRPCRGCEYNSLRNYRGLVGCYGGEILSKENVSDTAIELSY